MTTSMDDKAILSAVLDRWKAGVDAHRPERVAALFTEDAVFQGLHPYSVGRQYVAGSDGGLRDVHEPQPGLRLLLDQRLHATAPVGTRGGNVQQSAVRHRPGPSRIS